MTIRDYLSKDKEPMPDWLADWDKDSVFSRRAFFSGRTVFYPGSGHDGQPVKLFGASHSAHSFVFVDYMVKRDEILRELKGDSEIHNEHPDYNGPFTGYNVFDSRHLRESDLAPNGWQMHCRMTADQETWVKQISRDLTPYAELVIFERDAAYDESHGPERLAIIFVGGDGVATYDAVYCQRNGARAPYALVVQDHGFGGGWCSFGDGGPLHKIAAATFAVPDYLLVGIQNTTPWRCYEPVGAGASLGGMHHVPRELYKYDRF